MNFTWSNISVSVPDRANKNTAKQLLDNVNGQATPGEVVALMGPSGCGKTTLLNILANRQVPAKSTVDGQVCINGTPVTPSITKEFTSYVEQEDSLIGSLTVRETLDYAAQLHGVSSKSVRKERVDELLQWFGLEDQQSTIVGTVLQKGISGGQKRRLSVASQLITQPKVLFLDEPTSGLDSSASYMVISQLRKVARAEGMMVIASIHQPSTSTLNLFDKLLMLSQGQTVYYGETQKLVPYFAQTDYPIPASYNPAEYILDLINVDFAESDRALTHLVSHWNRSAPQVYCEKAPGLDEGLPGHVKTPNELQQSWVLLKRLFIKSRRDLLSYYVRLAMYLGLAIMMGTVWLRLGPEQDNIQPYINAIFFSGAFMSFMAVAYIPSYLEDFQSYHKDRLNGLYGPTAFMISNFLIGVPFLFLITVLFSVVTYFMVNFHETAVGFFRYVMWLFLDLVAAESLVILISSVAPVFVVALALVAFANGLFMSVGGFLVSPKILNVFWYYTFYWVDYQRYVFQGMMFNEFEPSVYQCGAGCHCMYDSPLADQCKIQGSAVLRSLGYGNNKSGEWVGLLVVLIFVYRLLAWGWLYGVSKLKR